MTDTPSNYEDVGAFHEKFGLAAFGTGPTNPSPELLEFRWRFLQEEVDEFKEGVQEGNQAKMFDALLDIVYVALGTAHLCGYPWQRGWNRVQEANMAKVRAQPDGSDSKRGSSFDVVKPPGWEPPDIEGLLAQYGFGPKDRCPRCRRPLTEGECSWNRISGRGMCSVVGAFIA